jgi:hypothetical protein
LIYCKNVCKCHNEPPPSTIIKKRKEKEKERKKEGRPKHKTEYKKGSGHVPCSPEVKIQLRILSQSA